jgi:hypothetical protein
MLLWMIAISATYQIEKKENHYKHLAYLFSVISKIIITKYNFLSIKKIQIIL